MVEIKWNQNVVPHRILREQPEVLKNKANFLPPHLCKLLCIHRIDVLPIQQNVSGRGRQQSSQNLQKSGFPAATGTNDGRKFPLLNRQIAGFQCLNSTFALAIGFGNLHSFQNFVFHKMSPFDAFFRIKEKTGSKAAPSQNPISRMLTRI